MMDRISLGEALDDYEGKIEKAVEKLLGIDEVEATRVLAEIPLDEFLNLASVIDNRKFDDAKRILQKYAKKAPSVESISRGMKKRIAERRKFVIPSSIQSFTLSDQLRVLETMQTSELQKILSNLNGYASIGLTEGDMMDGELVSTILIKLPEVSLKSLAEAVAGRPGEQQQSSAYGSGDEDEPSPANTTADGSGKKTATYTNDRGDTEEGEVIAQDAASVTVKGKTGTKRIDIENAMVNETNIIKLSDFRKDK